jgi:hypothetical protein
MLLPGVLRGGEADGGGSVVADVLVAGFLGGVGAAAGAFDGAGAGAVPARGVEVLFPGDGGADLGEEAAGVVRGKKPGRRPGG